MSDLARAEKLLNNRPRKILNWQTPHRVFAHVNRPGESGDFLM